MKRAMLTLALAGALFPLGTPLMAEQLTEDDFDDHGTGLVLRPLEGVENLDGPSGRIHKAPVPKLPPTPAPLVAEKPAPHPPARKVTGKALVQPEAKRLSAKRSVTRLELASILDKYLDYIKQQKAEIEQKMEAIPIQKGLPAEALARMDKLVGDLDNLATEEGNLSRMVKDLSGKVHDQGVEVHKLKIAEMISGRRLDRLERATGLSKKAIDAEPTPEEAAQADKLVQRVERLEDLLHKSLTQLSEATTRLEGLEQPAVDGAASADKGDAGTKIAGRAPARIPFASAGGVTIGAEREAYRRKLLARVKDSIASRETDPAAPAAKTQPTVEAPKPEPPAASDEGSAAPPEPSAPPAQSEASESAETPAPVETASTESSDDSSDDPEDQELPNLVDEAKGGGE